MNKVTRQVFLLAAFMLAISTISAQKYYPTVDTYIQQNGSNANEKKNETQDYLLETRYSPENINNRISFIEFNLGNLTKQTTKAELNLFLYETVTNGFTSESVSVYNMTSGFFDRNTTWNNIVGKYTVGASLASNTVNITDGDAYSPVGWYKFDITNLINTVAATAGTEKKIQLCIKNTSGKMVLRWASSSADDNYTLPDCESVNGVKVIDKNNRITILKNANNQITVDCNANLSNNASVSVYNVTGQKLILEKLTGTRTVIRPSFGSGVYVVKVNNAGINTTQKVILN